MQSAKLVLLFALLATPVAKAQSIPTHWKAQALASMERLQQHTGERTMKEACNAMLDGAFSMHVRAPGIVHKTQGRLESYHMILKRAEGELFDLVWIYQGDKLFGERINQLPISWSALWSADGGVITVYADQCIYIFPAKNPFGAMADTSAE